MEVVREGMGMPAGIVKVFHRSRGYGFIRPEAGGEDLFVHRRVLEAAGIKHLRKGQRVSFDQANDLGRPFATNLRLENKAGSQEVNGASTPFSRRKSKIQMRLTKSRTSPFESRSPARLSSNRWRRRFVVSPQSARPL